MIYEPTEIEISIYAFHELEGGGIEPVPASKPLRVRLLDLAGQQFVMLHPTTHDGHSHTYLVEYDDLAGALERLAPALEQARQDHARGCQAQALDDYIASQTKQRDGAMTLETTTLPTTSRLPGLAIAGWRKPRGES